MSGFNFTRRALERVAEDKIRAAAEQGEFDNLPGKGKPIPSLQPDRPDAPDWWVKRWVGARIAGAGGPRGGAEAAAALRR